MKKWNLALAISWSIAAVLYTITTVGDLLRIEDCLQWHEVVDIIVWAGYIGCAIFCWIKLAKDKKKEKESE